MCKIYDMPFQELFDTLNQSYEELTKEVDGVLFNAAYNTCWMSGSPSLEFDRLGQGQKYPRRCSVSSDISEAHLHMFCSSLQFKTWYALLKGDIEDVADSIQKDDKLMVDGPPTQKNTKYGMYVGSIFTM